MENGCFVLFFLFFDDRLANDRLVGKNVGLVGSVFVEGKEVEIVCHTRFQGLVDIRNGAQAQRSADNLHFLIRPLFTI